MRQQPEVADPLWCNLDAAFVCFFLLPFLQAASLQCFWKLAGLGEEVTDAGLVSLARAGCGTNLMSLDLCRECLDVVVFLLSCLSLTQMLFLLCFARVAWSSHGRRTVCPGCVWARGLPDIAVAARCLLSLLDIFPFFFATTHEFVTTVLSLLENHRLQTSETE